MELKQAVTVFLISLLAAALVLLIARAVDLQGAARIEPQLVRIADELEALRRQGGIAPAPSASLAVTPSQGGLTVYYLHGKTRCPTCQDIESQAHAVVHSDFSAPLSSGAVRWMVANYEDPAAAELARKFGVQMPVVVLATTQSGEITRWKRLDRVWALAGNKPAFTSYLREEIGGMLQPSSSLPAPAPAEEEGPPAKPVAPAPEQPAPADLPIPE